MRDRLSFVFAALALTGLGLVSGWYAARGGAASTAPEPAATPEEPAADADHGHEIHLSPAARTNLGVTTAPLARSDFTRPRRIAAVVEETPLATRPVHAVIGGRVIALGPDPGQTVAAGGVLIEILREPIARPQLQVAREALIPDHGEIHAAIRSLREGIAAHRIAVDELARLQQFSGEDAPVVPRERLVELEYQRRRTATQVDSVAHELERHGFSDEHIARLAAGEDFAWLLAGGEAPEADPEEGAEQEPGEEEVPVFDAAVVEGALRHAGIWTTAAGALLGTLPEGLRGEPVAVATIGELIALRRAPEDLAPWLADTPAAAARFLDVAALLLGGMTLADIRELVALGMLDERFAVRAPDDDGGFRVVDYHVRPGAPVTAGAELVTLHDPRAIRLRVNPVGSEIALVVDALARQLRCRAEPLLPDTGPSLDDVVLSHVVGAAGATPAAAFAELTNTPLDAGADGTPRHRSWLLRPGTRYELLVPTETFDDVFVLPREAVIEDGGERAVLIEHVDDGGFEEVPVTIAWQDHRRVVLRPSEQDRRLTAGTPVVVRGAFEIGLQMHAGDHAMEHDHH